MPDIIIIGGGVIGSSIAYHLSEQSTKEILLLERDEVSSHASKAAAGMLGAQAELYPGHPLFSLAKKSLSWFREHTRKLEEKSEVPIYLNLAGTIQLALTEDEWIQFQQRKEKWQDTDTEIFEYSKLHSSLPSLSDEVRGGLWVPDGQLDAPNLTKAWVRAAIRQGVLVREKVNVRSLIIKENRVCGVITDNGPIEAKWVILAGGAWSNECLPSHLKIPLIPVKGEAFFAQLNSISLQHTFFTKEAYLVPKQKNFLLIGATEHVNQMDEKVSLNGIHQLFQRVLRLFPFLKEAHFVKAWAGVRPQTPDGLPVLGMSSQVQGLIYAVGHYRNGILLSAITGKIVSDLILKGKTSLDITPFSPDRWR